MKKQELFTKMFCSIILSSVLIFVFTGCRPNSDIDPSKTQLYVGNWNGGIGYQWLLEAKSGFETLYPDVQIIIDNKKDEFDDGTLRASMPYSRNDIFFLNSITYHNYVNAGILEDITDVVTEVIYDEDGNLSENNAVSSIYDKIQPNLKDYYNAGTSEELKYYALPFFEGVYGIVYDVDLFEDNNLFDNGVGPDGKPGTFDDGLPATYVDFKKLMTKMVNSGIYPFTWSGMHGWYRSEFMKGIWSSYEGSNHNLNYSLSGFDTGLNLQITNQNGLELQKQEGKKAALQVAYDIVSNINNFSPNAFKTAHTHIHAQEEFLLSIRKEKPIAMLIEGGWWENEARGMFNDMEAMYGQKFAYGNRRLSYMPFPKFVDPTGTTGIKDQDTTENSLFLTHAKSAVCVNKAGENKDLAKEFIKYVHSNEMLSMFTGETGVTRPYNYTIKDDDFEKMTYFSKSVWNLTRSEGKTLYYYNIVTNEAMLTEPSYFAGFQGFRAKVGNTIYSDPLRNFYLYKDLTVQNYFQGFYNNYSDNWESTWANLLS